MRALDRKLLRDLWHLRGMVLAIALVLSGGVATFVMALSTYDSLVLSQRTYYRDYRFAQVFASLKRAPESVRARILAMPEVDRVQTRVVASANLDVPGFSEPVIGRLVSVPDTGTALLNTLHLRQGRMLRPQYSEEVLISDTFAEAHGLQPGDHLAAIINGKRKTLRIVGVALSPEYIYQFPPGGAFPDYERYGVLWMGRSHLAAAYDLEGAFNDVSLSLTANATEADVITRLDALLAPYGGVGAIGRADQISHRFLSEELRGLRTMSVVFPVVFLGVAAFLLNVVIGRLISSQRDQIAILKAFGYSNSAIGLHFVKLVLVIVAVGVAGGVALGAWFGHGLSGLYMEFYRFPQLHYRVPPWVWASAASISVAAGLSATVYAVARAARLPPAQAMRPESPAVYRPTVIERLGLQRKLSQPSRMLLRHLERRPLRAAFTTVGIASACAIVMVSSFQEDAVTYMIDVQYGLSQRQDLTVTFIEATSARALYSLSAIDGVRAAEGFRAVPVRLRHQHLSFRTHLEGLDPDARLSRLLDAGLNPVVLPQHGVILTDYLARLLRVQPGDRLRVEVLEGARPVFDVPVAGLTTQYLGVGAYLPRRALNRLLEEGHAISGAHLAIDPERRAPLYAQLKAMPQVAGTIVRAAAVDNFYESMEENILYFTFITALLGSAIAFGVVYNSARIALSERDRELASLRVLGFSRTEVGYILLGELTILTLLAIPVGFLIGRLLCAYIAYAFRSDLYRLPLVLDSDSYAFAASVVLVSACISGLLIWRQLARLDLIGVLKTRE